jgi:hypothetical protein
MVVYREAATRVGREAIAAFSWSCGTLLIGVLISAYKAHWLPSNLWPKWLLNGGPDAGGTPFENADLVDADQLRDLNADHTPE